LDYTVSFTLDGGDKATVNQTGNLRVNCQRCIGLQFLIIYHLLSTFTRSFICLFLDLWHKHGCSKFIIRIVERTGYIDVSLKL